MTIYDIATAAGVSASTVSRVINHKSGIRKETREKIEKLIEEYNYSPNVAARGLVMQSSKMIGILLVDIRVVHHIDNAFAIEQELAKRGYCSIIMSTGADEANIGSCIRQLEQRRVEGIALIGSMFMAKSTYHTIKTYLPNIPVVIINGYIDLPNVTGIIADEESGVKDCVALLARKGRKNIVYVNDADSPANRNKRKGFLAGIRALGYPPPAMRSRRISSARTRLSTASSILLTSPRPAVCARCSRAAARFPKTSASSASITVSMRKFPIRS